MAHPATWIDPDQPKRALTEKLVRVTKPTEDMVCALDGHGHRTDEPPLPAYPDCRRDRPHRRYWSETLPPAE